MSSPRQIEIPLSDKVRFLQRPESYPERPARIETRKSHMSWVFLTRDHAYKLKKPVRLSYLDFGTIEARRQDCEAEVRLNRRFAPNVYLDTVALTLDASGRLQLGGDGAICDWLVKMVRLLSERTLEARIARQAVDEDEVREAIRLLARVYRRAAPIAMTPEAYRRRFTADIDENLAELTRADFALPTDLPHSLAASQRAFVERRGELLDARARDGRIVEAHGDLRPEHIYLGDPPIIMDCLEFNRELRLLDPADELAYLAVECRRLGAPHLGDVAFDAYREVTGDAPPSELIGFYASFRAMLRAKLAVWHLEDAERADFGRWRTRAMRYLEIAADQAVPLD